jgi:hypothetical protein
MINITLGNEKVILRGHDHLLEIRLLKKSACHDFIIARHRSSNNIFSCQLLESSSSLGMNWIRAV